MGGERDAGIFIAAIILNSAALVAWEWGQTRAIDWLQARWIANLVGTAIVVLATVLTINWLFYDGYYDRQTGSYHDSRYLALYLAPFVYAVVIGGIVAAYYKWKQDLFMLSASGVSIIVLTAALFFWLSDQVEKHHDTLGFLGIPTLAGIVIIAETSLLAAGLLRLRNRWEEG